MTIEIKKDDKFVKLLSKDEQEYKIQQNIMMQSGLISDMLEDQVDAEESDVPEIPLPNVDSKALQKVIDYCKQHHNNKAIEIEKPLKGKIEDVICDWDKKFLEELDQSVLIELIMASNYMNIKSLLDLTCAKIASMIKGKSPEQIREMFDIENDFTPEEEEKIREENKWCEES